MELLTDKFIAPATAFQLNRTDTNNKYIFIAKTLQDRDLWIRSFGYNLAELERQRVPTVPIPPVKSSSKEIATSPKSPRKKKNKSRIARNEKKWGDTDQASPAFPGVPLYSAASPRTEAEFTSGVTAPARGNTAQFSAPSNSCSSTSPCQNTPTGSPSTPSWNSSPSQKAAWHSPSVAQKERTGTLRLTGSRVHLKQFARNTQQNQSSLVASPSVASSAGSLSPRARIRGKRNLLKDRQLPPAPIYEPQARAQEALDLDVGGSSQLLPAASSRFVRPRLRKSVSESHLASAQRVCTVINVDAIGAFPGVPLRSEQLQVFSVGQNGVSKGCSMRVQAPKPRKADEGLDVGGFVLSSAAGVAHGFLGYLKEDEALNMEKATLKKNKKSK